MKSRSLDLLRQTNNKVDLAKLLGVSPVFLTNTLYRIKVETLYNQIKIPKKTGGIRYIYSPDSRLKEIQRNLSNLLLNCLDEIRAENKTKAIISHGFEREKNIITNAKKHINKNIVLNLDLESFFDSFNFGRVRGFFIKNKYFLLNDEVATVIAQISCLNIQIGERKISILPQGSPCSPVITNLISSSMDIKLNSLAKRNRCTYTRYADDITISTNLMSFGKQIVKDVDENNNVSLGNKLISYIEKSGFVINDKKTRIQYKNSRQDVTGLLVNKKINPSRKYSDILRSMCNSLFNSGEFELIDKEKKKRKGTINELEGKLSFVDQIDRFNNKDILSKGGVLLKNRRENLYSKFIYFKKFIFNDEVTVITEGHTDHIYIRSAAISRKDKFNNLIKEDNKKIKLNFSFLKINNKIEYLLDVREGTSSIKKFIERFPENYSKYNIGKPKKPVIIILDNDSGSSGSGGIFQLLISDKFKNITNDKDEIRNVEFIHVFGNLYIIFTPLKDGKDTSMEDLFSDEILNKKMNEKKFNRTNKKCKNDEFGKDYFARFVIKPNVKTIDFSKFDTIFNRIKLVISDYEKKEI